MRIAVDAMGADHGPGPLVEGALRALGDLPATEIVFVGREQEIGAAIAFFPQLGSALARTRVVAATEVIEMSEPPAQALRRKKDSSMRRAIELVASGDADGVVSAGSTGAVAVGMSLLVGLVEGVDRPAIATVLPTLRGNVLLLDVGANADCRSQWLVQFAIMGRLYSEVVLGKSAPTVGLLSIGEEPSKGNDLTKEAHALLQAADVGFLGNVEGKDIFTGRTDVVVCDGFVGNVLLKCAESFPSILAQVVREEMARSALARAGLWLARPALRRVAHRLDWETYGGAPLLGVDGACIICHGRSGPTAIRNAVRVAHDFVAGRVKERIAEKLKGVA